MSDQSEELPLMAPPPTPTPTISTSRPVQPIKFSVEFSSKPTNLEFFILYLYYGFTGVCRSDFLYRCTLLDVENALAKFTWAKEVHKKMVKLKEEGKPMLKNFAEVQKLMGSTPLDLAKFNKVKSGEMSRNAPCPCGSKKRYKR
ncbi:hypothetical protein GOBAR_DD35404 [Gossypium barbadense]|nr:hypothetical protein GOBAR_DD35404 [Gossypium barbadense]